MDDMKPRKTRHRSGQKVRHEKPLSHFPSLFLITLPLFFNGVSPTRAEIELYEFLSTLRPTDNPLIFMYDNNPITFLNLNRLPARVDYQGAGVLLHFEPVAIRALVAMGYLKPVGNLKGSEHKYFCTKTIQALANDEKWVNDASRAVSKYWAAKNCRRKSPRHLNNGKNRSRSFPPKED